MNAQNRRRNAETEMEKATDALAEANLLCDAKRWEGSVSRTYYALLHAVKALFLSQGLEARTHDGVETLFSLHFIKSGTVEREWVAHFARLQRYREQADYGPVLGLSGSDIRRELDLVTRFHGLVREILSS